MAAPTVTARNLRVPAGARLKNGFQILVVFAADPDVGLWEVDVTPPGLEGGEPVNITTQYNEDYETMAARALKTMTQGTFNAGYDPECLDQLNALINVETSITVHFPNNDSWTFYGYLKNFQPATQQQGTMPLAACQIQPTNYDPTNNVEAAPVFTAAA